MNTRFILISALLTLLLAACGPVVSPMVAGTQPPIAVTGLPNPTKAPVTTQPLGAGNEVAVKISGFAFAPAALTISVGTTVKWTNLDSAPHTVVADDNSWASGRLNTGDSFTISFTQAGTFSYHCGVHPNMKATIIVTP